MKKVIFLILLSVLILGGCSEQLTGPSNEVSEKKEFIKIPVDNSLSSELSFSVSKIVNGEQGGTIILNKTYISLFKGKVILANAVVNFPPGSFKGEERITLTANADEASITFNPHLVFNNEVNLTLAYTGLDLSNLKGSEVNFVYMDDAGNIEQIPNESLIVNELLGTLIVKGAKLKHFSRYGFIKNSEE